MKQPTPHGAFMGLETVIKAIYKGSAASYAQWELFRNGIPHQMGLLDENGAAGEIKIDLDDDGDFVIYFETEDDLLSKLH